MPCRGSFAIWVLSCSKTSLQDLLWGLVFETHLGFGAGLAVVQCLVDLECVLLLHYVLFIISLVLCGALVASLLPLTVGVLCSPTTQACFLSEAHAKQR